MMTSNTALRTNLLYSKIRVHLDNQQNLVNPLNQSKFWQLREGCFIHSLFLTLASSIRGRTPSLYQPDPVHGSLSYFHLMRPLGSCTMKLNAITEIRQAVVMLASKISSVIRIKLPSFHVRIAIGTQAPMHLPGKTSPDTSLGKTTFTKRSTRRNIYTSISPEKTIYISTPPGKIT